MSALGFRNGAWRLVCILLLWVAPLPVGSLSWGELGALMVLTFPGPPSRCSSVSFDWRLALSFWCGGLSVWLIMWGFGGDLLLPVHLPALSRFSYLGGLLGLLWAALVYLRGPRLELQLVRPEPPLGSRSGESCVTLALLEVWFCLCCRLGHDVRICGTFGTGLEVLSRGSFVVLCLWLRLLPPWKGFWWIPQAWIFPGLLPLPWGLSVS